MPSGSSNDLPTLLIHGDKHTLVTLKQSQQIYGAFQKTGVIGEMIVIERAGRGFKGDDNVRATKALFKWFDRRLVKKQS